MERVIQKLQFITQEYDHKDHLYWVEVACKNGVNWVQLRVKDKSFKEIKRIATEALKICNEHNSVLIINDHFKVAHEIGAHGVHIGKMDICPSKARKILGEKFIIGGTANTLDDIKILNFKKVDYIGLGPYRYTKTKKNLSPILGLNGYNSTINNCKKNRLIIPIVAIGGIETADIFNILDTGIYGIAVSSNIIAAKEPSLEIKRMIESINEFENVKNR